MKILTDEQIALIYKERNWIISSAELPRFKALLQAQLYQDLESFNCELAEHCKHISEGKRGTNG